MYISLCNERKLTYTPILLCTMILCQNIRFWWKWQQNSILKLIIYVDSALMLLYIYIYLTERHRPHVKYGIILPWKKLKHGLMLETLVIVISTFRLQKQSVQSCQQPYKSTAKIYLLSCCCQYHGQTESPERRRRNLPCQMSCHPMGLESVPTNYVSKSVLNYSRPSFASYQMNPPSKV